MIYGIGTDVVEVIRIKESIEKYGDKLAKKILTDEEMIAYKSSTLKENFLAKRLLQKKHFLKLWERVLGVKLICKPFR
jgi:holo-[acyl-carrier protein] synthase